MKQVLIIRLSAIGDVVFASPIISAIKAKYPDAKISWLAEPAVKGLLQHHPDLHEVIVWDKARWKKLWEERQFIALWKEVRALVRLLRLKQFDTALDMQGLLKSGIWAWLSGAKRRVGLGSREGSQYLMSEVVHKAGDVSRIGSEYHYLAGKLGLENEPFPMRVDVDTNSAFSATQHINDLSSYIVICPFTTRPQKHWLDEHWQVLIGLIRKHFELPVVILGGPGDREAAARIDSDSVINLVGKTSLLEAAELIDRADVVIGVDTGLTHIGIAKETPTIALFGSTCPYTHAPGAKLTVIYHQMECSPCRRRPKCDGRFDCMRAIYPEDVLSAAVSLRDVV